MNVGVSERETKLCSWIISEHLTNQTNPDLIIVDDGQQLLYHIVWSYGGNFSVLVYSIKKKIFSYPNENKKIIVIEKYDDSHLHNIVLWQSSSTLRSSNENIFFFKSSVQGKFLPLAWELMCQQRALMMLYMIMMKLILQWFHTCCRKHPRKTICIGSDDTDDLYLYYIGFWKLIWLISAKAKKIAEMEYF